MAMRRTAKENLTIGGKEIKAGQGIIASNQSANRDEDVFVDPDRFDIRRSWPEQDALGFGYGPHRCIAEHLAKAELRSVFCKFYSCALTPRCLAPEWQRLLDRGRIREECKGLERCRDRGVKLTRA